VLKGYRKRQVQVRENRAYTRKQEKPMDKVKKIIEVIKALMEKNPRVISRSEATRNLSYAFMLQDFSPSFTGLVHTCKSYRYVISTEGRNLIQ
jgi:hypothetical protein